MTALLVGIGIAVLITFIVYNVYKDIPPQFQQMPAGQVWFLLIPLFNIIWNFIAYPKISESFRMYAQSKNMDDGSDYGRQLATIYAVCMAIGILCGLFSLVGLIIWIIWLVKMYDYKRRLA
ncbi:MAG TPA: hypothetical protein VJ835_03190 [Fimbriimonadaceae bacterium]|nr:hypothetical protein [Fimbriimonadaceae bacterium]